MKTVAITQEVKKQGLYDTVGTWYGVPYTAAARLSPPITPRENLLAYYSGGGYRWVPDAMSDQMEITPDNIPDVVACGYEGGIDAFGVEWVPLENGLPSMVKPGNPKLKDIADWRKLAWPDVGSWAWADYGERYKRANNGERFSRGVILSGFFERLISLMDFEPAALAMMTDPEEVSAFFGKLADLNIRIVEHYKRYFDVDGIMLHDDWAAQRSPFFSLDMVGRLIVPHLRRVVDKTHELGLIFTLHSCGNGLDLAPAMIEAGVDTWQIQENSIDYKKALEVYGSRLFIEGYWVVPDNDDEAKAFIQQLVHDLGKDGRGLFSLMDFTEKRGFDVREYAYVQGRSCVIKQEA